jgi:hypothetical protein
MVWGEDFSSRAAIQSRGAVIVGCQVGASQGGSISPTAVSSRVTFGGTNAVLDGANRMTIALRFKTPATLAAGVVLSKSAEALTDNQWFVQFESGYVALYIANAIGDFGQILYTSATLALSTEYVMHASYDGTLAAASRGAWYVNGAVAGSSITGTLPTKMRASLVPITALQRSSGTTRAPATDFILRSARIYSVAWTAQECADDYAQQTYNKVFGGGA